MNRKLDTTRYVDMCGKIPEWVFLALANHFCVWLLIFFADSRRPNFAHFVWDVIDTMHNPDFFWYVLSLKVS